MEHICVTGGAGYLGSVLVPRLLNEEYRVTVVDRLDYGIDGLLSCLENTLLKIEVKDIAKDIINYGQYDCVVHLAARTGEELCDQDKDDAWKTNILGTQKVLDTAQDVIFASTCSNYGVCDSGTEADENHTLNPLGLYSGTKIRGEELVKEFNGKVLRFGTLFGLSPRMRFDVLINQIARAIAFDEQFEVYGPDNWRPFLSVHNACAVIQDMINWNNCVKWGNGYEIYNVASVNITKRMLMAYAEQINPKFTWTVVNEGDKRNYAVSSDKLLAKQVFGWQDSYVPWHLEQISFVAKYLVNPRRRIYTQNGIKMKVA